MKRLVCRLVTLGAVSAALGACGSEQAPINQVGVNVVEKSVFEGSWLMSSVVIDVDYEAAGIGTYPGDSAYDFATNALFAMPRIRWVIDESYLYAYRDYELTAGVDGAPREAGDHFGQPVAAFRILSHFDIKRMYNSTTGEELNVVYEDTSDRRWYDRKYMRVDWSKNLIPGYFGQIHKLYEVIGYFTREPADLYVQNESEFPDSWRPQFHRMSCDGLDDSSADCRDGDRDHASDYEKDELFHMSFVTQDLLSPGKVPDPFTGEPVNWCATIYGDAPECTTVAVYTRTSFLKVSDRRQYEPVNWTDTRFEKAGYFRLEQNTTDRSTSADDPAYFETDFLNYNINRHNLWRQWRDDEGDPIPYADREVRPIVWYTTPELPAHLVKPSYELVGAWNETIMAMVRRLRGEAEADYGRVDCQDDDPDGYCTCTRDPDTGEILNPTCPGVYDPFVTPDAAEAAGAENPYDCWVEVPDEAEAIEARLADNAGSVDLGDADFNPWFGATVRGSECAVLLRLNSCNRATTAANGGTTDGLDCEERGDMRYRFLSYVDQPGTQFLGIATLRSDPVTGEIFTGDANIGGPALDSYRTSALLQYDLMNGELDENELMTGEDVRTYLQALNNVELPAPPRPDFTAGLKLGTADAAQLRAADRRMAGAMAKISRLRGAEGQARTFSHRLESLRGTDLERRLTDNAETFVAGGVDWLPGDIGAAQMNELLLDRGSPLRMDVHAQLKRLNELQDGLARANIMMPNEFVDDSVAQFVSAHADWSRARLEIGLNRLLFYETELHEMGHCLGLRHDFGASADTGNYFDDYYAIDAEFPLPNPADFDDDGTPGLSVAEQEAYRTAYEAARHRRELAGIDRWMNSSVMEYTANWYERVTSRAGRYDAAAIALGYGDLIELYDNSAGLELSAVTPVNTPRVWAKYYHGGETCESDADCPFNEAGPASADLLATNTDAGLTQRCVPNPRGASGDRMCSSFDDDVLALAGTDTSPAWVPVNYRYCTDERAAGGDVMPGTIGWCNRFDEGDSYREIVRNVAESYERMYLFSNFRRYRRWPEFGWAGNYVSSLIGRRLVILQNVYQNLIYEYVANPEFRASTGEFGFYDEFMATADILNFYARILGQPDVGCYRWSNAWERYQQSDSSPTAPGCQVSLPVGLGKYTYSNYQRGLSGIQRVDRIGTFLDKLYAMQLMTLRGWQTSYTRDVPFYTNFYDLFPVEMQGIFGGMIRGEPAEYMPRVSCAEGSSFPNCLDPRVTYMDFYRGDCGEGSTTCRPEPQETYASLPVLDGGGFFLLQIYATIFGLSEFPVFFDTSFQNQLFICVEGQGDCHQPSASAVEGVDYVRYTSVRYGKSFLAWQVEPTDSVVNQTSIGFGMLADARDSATLLRILRKYRGDDGGGAYTRTNLDPADEDALDALDYEISTDDPTVDREIDRMDGRVSQLESFFNQLIEFERQFGVLDYLGF